ncbi:hypothetical protein [Flavobacterium denitrificans]|uniref:hypothetical protein n=1 Tax=Flavobacterium denitrificans TaxID=281361 RepID=UPI00041DE175|nr:hypothetical protein [Flavobacterium denitrificans]
MKWKLMAQTVALFNALFGTKELPIDGESQQLNLSAEQRQKIVDALGEKHADAAINGINSEIKNMAQENLNIKAIKDEIDAMVKLSALTAEELANVAKDDDGNPDTVALIKAIADKQETMAAQIQKLIADPEGDKPEAIISGTNKKIMHSATHLFGTTNAYDAFEGRNWNRRAAGQVSAATDFTNQPTIQKLNDDLDLYFRQNPEELKSLHRDNFGLPSFWPKRTKVDDKVADATIATAEISQARKLPWLPKNRQTIKPEEGQIFPIQIDIEYVGFYLQKIEASWLNMMNKEGSQPYKNSFVRFLVSEIDKKARQEDRIATIKGVYVETPEDATVPGKFINRQNGLLYLAQQARDVTKKYRAFDLGMPTASNIVDYVDSFIKALPYDVRTQQGLVYYLSDAWLKAYKRRSETLFGTNTDYTGYPTHPKDYNNIKFEVLIDQEGTDFMFITFDDNIEILENIPAEKSLYHFEYLKRMIYIWADYKLGVRFIHIGNPVVEGDPLEFSVQTLWSNTAPVFPSDFYVPVNDDATGKVKVVYKNMYVQKDWATTITEFTNATPGSVIKLKGDTGLVAATTVADGAKISLTGDVAFNLKTGGTLTLFVNPDGTVKELSRTSAPESIVVADVNFDTAVIDANLGVVFRYTGAATKAITGIVNGVEGKTIKIFGTDAVSVDVTLSDTGNINVASSATLLDATDYVQLTLVDGVWVETGRLIA